MSSADHARNSPSVCAGTAATHISSPDSTGYSTVPPCSSPSGVIDPVR